MKLNDVISLGVEQKKMRTTITLDKFSHQPYVLSRGITKGTNLGLIAYAERIAEDYLNKSSANERKSKGQFFTPRQVSLFMASLLNIDKQKFSVLDPGAGTGMLSAAVCESILSSRKQIDFSLDAYETDSEVIPLLENVLHKCQTVLRENGHKFKYRIIAKDFILDNSHRIKTQLDFGERETSLSYDYIISNPPYYKLNKNSPQTLLLNEIVSGQPNIYTFFMTLSLDMLKSDGKMMFITPRSFCSGLYFKPFRKWLLQHGQITNIHMFESRSNVFGNGTVLQESIITGIMPKKNEVESNKVTISTSQDGSFHNLKKVDIDYQDILHQINGQLMIKVPVTKTDVKVQHIVNSWEYTLKDFGMKVSTGPVVSFRAEKYLSTEFIDENKTVPLLWMHNIQNMNIVWPIEKKKRGLAIKLEKGTAPVLVPVKNYVLVKRFSSKEQKRRLYAGVLLKSKFKYDKVGIENHLNYIYRYHDILSTDEVYGVAGILNSSLMDMFFRMLNGSTQVNAVDIDNLPLPSLEKIKELGKTIMARKPSIGIELDKVIIDVLGIDNDILLELNGGNDVNE
ncbi:MAG: N-6 DNA methylase [Elusimicrobia bacterium]|nr:N-6 DNA methylase [Candidatus Liberimonas magnetica]